MLLLKLGGACHSSKRKTKHNRLTRPPSVLLAATIAEPCTTPNVNPAPHSKTMVALVKSTVCANGRQSRECQKQKRTVSCLNPNKRDREKWHAEQLQENKALQRWRAQARAPRRRVHLAHAPCRNKDSETQTVKCPQTNARCAHTHQATNCSARCRTAAWSSKSSAASSAATSNAPRPRSAALRHERPAASVAAAARLC